MSSFYNLLLKITLFIFILIPTISHGQLYKQWEMHIPGGYKYQQSFGPNVDDILKTIQTDEGGFVTMVSKKIPDVDFGSEIYLFKFDSDGNMIWEYTYASSYDINEYPYDITLDHQGNILIAGRTTTFYQSGFEHTTEDANYLLIKLSSEGELIWEEELDFGSNLNYCAYVIADGLDFYTLGSIEIKNHNFSILFKYDADGNELWSKVLDTSRPHKLEVFENKIVCLTQAYSKPSMVYEFDKSGDELNSFEIENISYTKPKYDAEGNMYNFPFTGDFKVNVHEPNGISKWNYHKLTNLPSNVTADELMDCTFDDEGNVYVTGRYYGKHYGDTLLYTNCDILTAKIDNNGVVIWENIYNFDNTRSCQIGENIKIADNGYAYVLGSQSVSQNGNVFASRDAVLLVYNNSGERVDSFYYNSIYDKQDIGIRMILDDSDIYLLGLSQNEEDLYGYSIVKLSPTPSKTSNIIGNKSVILYPNPSSGDLAFKCDSEISNLQVVDYLGRKVYTQESVDCNFPIQLGDQIKTGMYYISFVFEDQLISKQVMIMKP